MQKYPGMQEPTLNLSAFQRKQRRQRTADQAFRMGNFAKALVLRVFLFKGCRVLELGSGPGTNILKYESSAPSFVAFVDVDEAALQETRIRLSGRRGQPTALAAYQVVNWDFSANYLPMELIVAQPYDVAVAFYSLQYIGRSVEAGRQFFININTLLGTNGILLAIVPNAERLRAARVPGSLFSVSFSSDDSGGSYQGYRFQVKGRAPFQEHTLQIEDLVELAAPNFVLQYAAPMERVVSQFSQQYAVLSASLRKTMLQGDQLSDAESELFNLYDVLIFFRNKA